MNDERVAFAQSIYGIGPQTAAKILAKMHEDDEAFFSDLFDAKLKYITTRQFWDERGPREPAAQSLYTAGA